MMHESGSILSSRQKGALRDGMKWQIFIGRKGQRREVSPAKGRWVEARSPSFGGWQGSIRQITSLVLTKGFLMD